MEYVYDWVNDMCVMKTEYGDVLYTPGFCIPSTWLPYLWLFASILAVGVLYLAASNIVTKPR